jgi:hypothetical protein
LAGSSRISLATPLNLYGFTIVEKMYLVRKKLVAAYSRSN